MLEAGRLPVDRLIEFIAHLRVRDPSGRFAVQIVCPDDLSNSGGGSKDGSHPPAASPEVWSQSKDSSSGGERAGEMGGGQGGSPRWRRIRCTGARSVTAAMSCMGLPRCGQFMMTTSRRAPREEGQTHRQNLSLRSRLGSEVPFIPGGKPRPKRRDRNADFGPEAKDLLPRTAECQWKSLPPVVGYLPERIARHTEVQHLKQPSAKPALQLHTVPPGDVDSDLPVIEVVTREGGKSKRSLVVEEKGSAQ